MGLFGFGKKKTPPSSPPPPSGGGMSVREALAGMLENAMKDGEGRIRVEDLLSAAAAVTGEAAIRATGEFDPDNHDFAPGQAVMSDAINSLLCGDRSDWEDVPPGSLFGIIRKGALAAGYGAGDFPGVAESIRVYVAGIGRGDDPQAIWGRPALSVPAVNAPREPPLRYAYELRERVRIFFKAQDIAPADQPTILAQALAVILGHVREAIDPGVAIRLTLETLNGMAKMAPMTAKHLNAAGG